MRTWNDRESTVKDFHFDTLELVRHGGAARKRRQGKKKKKKKIKFLKILLQLIWEQNSYMSNKRSSTGSEPKSAPCPIMKIIEYAMLPAAPVTKTLTGFLAAHWPFVGCTRAGICLTSLNWILQNKYEKKEKKRKKKALAKKQNKTKKTLQKTWQRALRTMLEEADNWLEIMFRRRRAAICFVWFVKEGRKERGVELSFLWLKQREEESKQKREDKKWPTKTKKKQKEKKNPSAKRMLNPFTSGIFGLVPTEKGYS